MKPSSAVCRVKVLLHQTGSGEMAAAATILHLVTPPPGPCSCSGRARQTAVWCFIRGLHDIIISSESRVAWLLGVKLRQVTTGGGAEAGVQLRGARRTRRTAAAGERDTGRHLAGVLYSVRCVQCTVLYCTCGAAHILGPGLSCGQTAATISQSAATLTS